MMRSHFSRHVIVWVVIIVVLFPILWIFTTSIRRDNAYISTSLFSDQITWQNYVDLILEPKNIPALYNEVSNIFSLGEPYNKMDERQILSKLNKDFKAFDSYFFSTKGMVSSISKDAMWIKDNVLPSSVKSAVEAVKKNIPLDMKYVEDVDLRLFKRYKSLPKTVRMVALYLEINGISSPSSSQVLEISEYFPNVLTAWKIYEKRSRQAAENLKPISNEVAKALSRVADTDEAKNLMNAYQRTYEMLENGNFSYASWFAPVYLREINANTFKLAKRLSNSESKELFEAKSTVLNEVRALENDKESFLKTYKSAISNMKSVYDAYVGKDKSKLENLNVSYSQALSRLNELEQERTMVSQKLTKDASEIALFSNDIIPTSMALNNFVSIVKRTLNGKKSGNSQSFYDFSEYISLSQKWLKAAGKSGDFSQVEQRVKSMLSDLEYLNSKNSVLASNTRMDAIANVQSSLPFVLIKLKASLNMSLPVLYEYSALKAKEHETIDNMQNVREEIKTLSTKISILQKKVNSAENEMEAAVLYRKMKDAVEKLKTSYEKIDTFDGAYAFLKNLSAFYANLKNANVSLPPMPDFSRYNEFFNVLKMKKMLTLTAQTVDDINVLVSKYADYIRELENRSKAYVYVNKLGFPLVVNELSSMNSLYQKEYVSKIGPNLGMISRLSYDLSKFVYFSKAKEKLNEINDKAYYITQEWKSKYIPPFMRWLLNSVIVASSAAVITVLLSAFMAYPFSRFRFVGRKYGLIGLLLVQMFPTMMAMVALYLLLNFIGKFFPPLGLNTLGGLAFLYIGGGIAFNAWLIKGFFDAIPHELEEAAMVDGATRFQTFWRIILPLSAPVLAVTTILGFVGNYGDYILASIVLTGINHYTYAVGLQTFSTGAYSTNWGLMTAAALIGMVPILAIFLGLQRFIVGGLTQGSVKG